MDKEFRIEFRDEGVQALATLLLEEAPETCRTISSEMPIEGIAHHAIYSGSEVAFVLPRAIRIDAERPTTQVSPGDIGFAWMKKGSHYGVTEDFAEICWFYDRDARPSMWEGPVAVTVFARLVEAGDFMGVCRRMRMEGAKRIVIRRG